MIDFANLSLFGWIVAICIFIMGGAVCAGLLLALRSRDELTRTVISDLVFYCMIAMFISWTLLNDMSIAYDIVLLGAIVAGVLPTLSMSRIISKGRR